MKIFLISVLKVFLKIIYAPLKLLKSKNRIVYLSRQSNTKSIDMQLLEQAIAKEDDSVEQIFRLKMIDSGFKNKVKYCFYIIKDMYYLATSKVAIVDTYSITVSCLKHKKSLKVIQMWHALGAIKKFGLQSLGTKDGRDEDISKAMCMHKNYDYILAPSVATAKFYMEGFGVEQSKIKICPLPRVDYLTDATTKSAKFYSLNPNFGDKRIVLYLPTFRENEAVVAEKLKVEFEDKQNLQLIISTHPLSKVKKDTRYSCDGDFSTFDLMKIADVIITDYSACAFEASLLMKPLYFFIPDYDKYLSDRGINVDVKEEMPMATFTDATKLVSDVSKNTYNFNELYTFKEKYIESAKNSSNATLLARFILMQLGEK